MQKTNEEIQTLLAKIAELHDIPFTQWSEYNRILHSLKVFGEEAVEPLIEALKDENRFIRYGAVVALGNIKDSRAVEPLINSLRDENPDVRRQAAISLGIIGDLKAVNPLIELLKDEDEFTGGIVVLSERIGSVRTWAMDGLMRLGEPALEMLKDALNDENPLVRSGAKWAINMIEEKR